MGGFKRRLVELEEIYGPAWSWKGVWEDPDSYPCLDKIQEIVCNSVRQDNKEHSINDCSGADPALENEIGEE